MQLTQPFQKTASATTAAPEATRPSSFRNLYTRVLLALRAQQHPVLGITSAIAGEGKTTVAAGIASALAEDRALVGFGRVPGTTLLVECNAGTPPADPRLNLGPGPGLIEVLRGECDVEAAIQATGVDGLSILPVGAVGEPAHELPLAIRTAALPEVLNQLRPQFGLVVLDMPAVLNSTDTQVLSRLADQIVLVVRAEVTPAKLVRQAIDELGEEKLLGVVLNDSRTILPAWLDQRL